MPSSLPPVNVARPTTDDRLVDYRLPTRGLTRPTALANLVHMIIVNMHEAKTRLSELVKKVEEGNEVVVVCRDGQEVAEIRRRSKRRRVLDLTPDPRFRAEFAPGYDPV